MKLGLLQWFDGEDGMILDVETKQTYYIHKSSLEKEFPAVIDSNGFYRDLPVLFNLYTNLYMSQVDEVKPIKHILDIPEKYRVGDFFSHSWNNLCLSLGCVNHTVYIP